MIKKTDCQILIYFMMRIGIFEIDHHYVYNDDQIQIG
jgi:hypothetical protein